ncbi:ABC transporter ATP-binding protein [Nocardia sp. NPDC050378]|uniref:ABC transporter ATP-binding protein n=1 Tax=Nocardia sp. NPDC050378 TaxID=3155400 RepID=UPI0033CF64EA
MTTGQQAALMALRGARAAYGAITVLHGVDLAVAPGQVLALLGPNGAGKSTALNVVAGIHALIGGSLHLGGREVTGAAARDLAAAGVCLIPEGRGIFPNLTVRENLWMMTGTGRRRAEIEQIAFDRFPVLHTKASQVAGTMSGGEQQMLALARGLATDPAVLLLDELSMGLAPLVVERLYAQVAEIARSGVAVLVVEQFAAAVLDIADHAAVLVRGRVVRQGHPDSGIRSELAALYLGSDPS